MTAAATVDLRSVAVSANLSVQFLAPRSVLLIHFQGAVITAIGPVDALTQACRLKAILSF